MKKSRQLIWIWFIGSLVVPVAVLIIALMINEPAPAPTSSSTPSTAVSTSTASKTPSQQFFTDLQAADLPILVNYPYTEEATAKAPCTVAAEGLSWSDILSLDEKLPLGPSEFGRMAAIGIRDECPRYLAVVPTGWLPTS